MEDEIFCWDPDEAVVGVVVEDEDEDGTGPIPAMVTGGGVVVPGTAALVEATVTGRLGWRVGGGG
jgi:hypothetical protein